MKNVCSEYTGTYSFKTGFFGLTDMPKEFQKAMDNTLKEMPGVFCFLDDNLLVSRGSVCEHNCLVENVFVCLNTEEFSLNLLK